MIREFIKERFSKTREKGSFSHGFSWTFSGTSLSFILQLIFAPILSRIYGPEAYGEFAIYNLIVTNFTVIATFSYPQALLSNRDESRYIHLSTLIIFLVILSSCIFSFVYFPFQEKWGQLFPDIRGVTWIPFVILVVVLATFNDILNKWNIRNSDFNKNIKAGITGQILSKLSALLYGIKIAPNGMGIILAEVVKSITHFIVISSNAGCRKFLSSLSKINYNTIAEVKKIRKDLNNYPKYIFPGNWINMISNQLPIIFFSANFSLYELGAYTFAGSLLAIPNKLIGNAIQPVYYNKAQEILESDGKQSLRIFTRKVTLYLFGIGLPIFLILIFFGESIFVLVFGDSWTLAGQVASYQAIIQISAFSVSPISSVFLILKKENNLLVFQIFLFSVRLISLSTMIFLDLDFISMVLIYSIINLIIYLFLHIVIHKILKQNG